MSAAAAQAWPPFVLVAGLILVGLAAARDGVFDALGSVLARAPRGARGLTLALLLTAATAAVLNLDTAAVFATPVLVLAARRRGEDERPYLYGALFMANAGSLFLPGSNLTNLLVLAHGHLDGLTFARHLFPAALAATIVTAAGVVAWQWRLRRGTGGTGTTDPARAPGGRVTGVVGPAARCSPPRSWWGSAAPPSRSSRSGSWPPPCSSRRGGSARWRPCARSVPVCSRRSSRSRSLLGTLARATDGTAHLMREAALVPTAAIGALSAVLVNNLPAASLLAAGPVRHPAALLVGLNVGPNLAVTGSLSALLWWRSARSVRARPDVRTVTRIGIVLAPTAIAVALLADLAAH